MKILFCVEQYADEGSRYYREFFRHLEEFGVRVSVVNLSRSPAFQDDVRAVVESYHSLGMTRAYQKGISALRDILQKEKPALVQGMETIPTFYAALALLTSFGVRPPLVYGRRHGPTEGWVARLMDQVAFWRAKRVIAVSEASAGMARREHPLGGRKITVIRSGVTLDQGKAPSASEQELLHDLGSRKVFTALLLARIRPVKGHGVAIRAAEILKSRGLDIRLLFVGEGEGRGPLEREAEDRGLRDQVTFTGHLEDVEGALRLADVMIVPSYADAFPKVAVEAFAAGVPVVASAVGGLVDLITHGDTGLLVEPGNPDALADALADLLAHPGKTARMAAKAQEIYRRELTPRVMVERYLEEYTRLVGEA